MRDACCEFLKAQLHSTNCLGIRAFADMHSCGDLMVAAHSFAEKHFSEVVQADEFLALPNIQVEELISSDQLTVPSEEKVQCNNVLLHSNITILQSSFTIQFQSITPSTDCKLNKFAQNYFTIVTNTCH